MIRVKVTKLWEVAMYMGQGYILERDGDLFFMVRPGDRHAPND